MSGHDPFQRVTAIVDLGAVERNCRMLRSRLAAGTELCAVVKADGYGHGMGECADAALRGGATRLAVATATEAFELRERVGAEVPIFVMGALTGAELDVALQARAELNVWRADFFDALAERAGMFGFRPRIHVKYDSGMGRLGDREPYGVARLADAAADDERVELAGVWTHFATADEEDEGYLRGQLESFREVALPIQQRHPGTVLHAANSAATLRGPEFHFGMVRCGIAVYGLDPFGRDGEGAGLEPALSLHTYVADVKRIHAGESVGYGRSWRAPADTWVGVLPIGYGDGYRRGLSNAAEVVVGGVRRPVVGTISMDNMTVDLGAETDVEPGQPAVALGDQGDERVAAELLAERLGTINYEITTGLTRRVPRAYRT
ncbi:MAG: alanine racemase [Solirubrobacterales bacterium]|nr:alanine racemase [Solirubrobacterales bacterium]